MNNIYIFYIFILSTFIHSYKILVVNPKIGYSHVNFFSQIADILTEAGHDVTVLAIDMDPSITHPGAYKAKIVTYTPSNLDEDIITPSEKSKFLWSMSNTGLDQLKMLIKLIDGSYKKSLTVFNDEGLTEKMKKEKFDLGITEAFNIYILGMFKVWGIKGYVTGFSMAFSDSYYKEFGLPFIGSIIPNHVSQFTDKMTFTERFQNLLAHVVGETFSYWYMDKFSLENEFNKKYGVGFFKGSGAIGDSSFMVINSNPFLDIPGPLSPKMVEVSGIGIKDPKPLDEYWDKILSLRSKTVLISFGTFLDSSHMPKQIKYGLLETIRRMDDITFIWKYEKTEDGTDKDIENLVLSKWLPQNDLLNDKRLSLFITHGGMGSITELAFRGVPAIAIPLFGDQLRNSKLIERQNFGIVMNKYDLTNSDILVKNIKIILEDEAFRRNVSLVSKRLNKRPIDSKKLLIKHIEFAANFGRLEVLDLASRDMGTIKYYNLDIIIPIIAIFYYCFYFSFIRVYRCFKNLFLPKMKKD